MYLYIALVACVMNTLPLKVVWEKQKYIIDEIIT